MRFDRIFEDLEGRFVHHEQEEMRAVAEDLARAERAQLTLADRMRASAERPVSLQLGPGLRIGGTITDVGGSWIALRDAGTGQRALIPLRAITVVQGLSSRARPAAESPISPLGLGSVLRGIARDRTVVRIETAAEPVVGRISGVGADAMDVASLPTGEQISAPGSTRMTIPLGALLAVILQ